MGKYGIPYEKQLEMYVIIIKFLNKHPNSEIKIDTVDDDGNPVGIYKNWFQKRYNAGEFNREIKELRNRGILDVSAKEIEQDCEKYGISKRTAKYIHKKYGNIDKFVWEYKSGQIELNEHEMELCEIQLPCVIALCSQDISVKQKKAYIKLIKDFCEPEQIELLYNGGYINIDEINQIVETFPDKRQIIINLKYGLNGKDAKTLVEIADEQGCSPQNINNSMNVASKKLRVLLNRIVKSRESFEDLKVVSFNQQNPIKIEELNLSNRIYMALKRVGIHTLDELDTKTEKELQDIKGIGKKNIEELRENLKNIPRDELKQKSEEQLKFKVAKQKREKLAYCKAYYNFMKFENIFNPNQIIEATITDFQNEDEFGFKIPNREESEEIIKNNLEEKKRQRESMEEEYATLKKMEISEDEKLEWLRKHLEERGIVLPSDNSSKLDKKLKGEEK